MSVELNERRQKLLAGGGQDRVARQHEAGKMTARERVAKLLDEGSFVEVGAFTAAKESASSVITGYGVIDERPVYVYAQDFTVKGGAMGAAAAAKIVRLMELAQKTGAPVIAMCDSAGADLSEGVEALNAYASIMKETAAISGVVPQISLVLGQCGGIASAIAGMTDITIMSKNGALFVNGPMVVSAVAGKEVDMATLAGPQASMRSGMAQLTAETDEEAIAAARKLVSMLPVNNLDEAVEISADDVNRELAELNGVDKLEDIRDLIRSVSDLGDFVELSADFAPSMVTALGKIGGATVGFIANQAAKDEGRLTVYGCKKAAAFASFCDCFSIPVVTVVDSMGMKISTAPQGELARNGAQLMFALSQATNVRIALIVGNAVGMGYAALASRASADVVYAWPGAVISAVTPKIAVQLNSADELKGADDPYAKRAELENRYMDDVADGVNAAKLGYVDDVIEPAQTRQMIAAALEMLEGKRESKPAKKHGNMPL